MATATVSDTQAGVFTVKVDGKALTVPRFMPDPITGRAIPTTMIQACALAKVEVPHYCYHPKLPVAGNCRICDQAGECKLQEYSVDYGQSESRFVEPKVHKPKRVDLGPRIVLDDERCILCTRCIRFTKDIVGDDALGIVSRGSYSTLTAYPGRVFDNNYTLNTVDLCPVGALTSRDFRFQMRVWFLKESKSICASCATGCNIVIGSREEKVYRYEPRENNAVNATWMCDYGRLNYKWIGREDRITKLQEPTGQNSTWPQVLKEIGSILNSAP